MRTFLLLCGSGSHNFLCQKGRIRSRIRKTYSGSHRIQSKTAINPESLFWIWIRYKTAIDLESLFRIWIRIRLGQKVPDLTGSGLKLRLIRKAYSGSGSD
jgi:hypothetical protein